MSKSSWRDSSLPDEQYSLAYSGVKVETTFVSVKL